MPQDVGILALSLYFPRYVVSQQDLEEVDGVKGKYTVGLGQEAMCFCSDREDAVSMAKTAMLQLLERYTVDPREIGRLAVGTETGVDRSKSIMSYLMEDMSNLGNSFIQGSDHQHACYGGTAALLSAVDWVHGPGWDGRLALVVAADIAVYQEGSAARPTGGCGAAALLVGPNAPLVVEPYPWQSHFGAHTFDFFKPHGHPCYPVVDGPASTYWFVRAAEACGSRMWQQLQQQQQQQGEEMDKQGAAVAAPAAGSRGEAEHAEQLSSQHAGCSSSRCGLVTQFDYFLSHAPFNKMVRKAFARLVLQDMVRQQQQQAGTTTGIEQQAPEPAAAAAAGTGSALEPPQVSSTATSGTASSSSSSSSGKPGLPSLQGDLAAAAAAEGWDPEDLSSTSIATNKQLEAASVTAALPLYEAMVAPGVALQRKLGNLYTASLYSGLAQLVSGLGEGLVGRLLLMYSFGSGALASLYVLRGREGCDRWSLARMAEQLRLSYHLSLRLPKSPADYDAATAGLVRAYGSAPFTPSASLEDLAPGTVYLSHVTEKFHRVYQRVPPGPPS